MSLQKTPNHVCVLLPSRFTQGEGSASAAAGRPWPPGSPGPETRGGAPPQACHECRLLRLLTLVQAPGELQTQGDRREPPNKIDD